MFWSGKSTHFGARFTYGPYLKSVDTCGVPSATPVATALPASNRNVFSVLPDPENMGVDTLTGQINKY